MNYQIELTKGAAKDLEKLAKSGIDLKPLKRYFSRLENNPYLTSEKKSGDLADSRAVDWGNGYRLVFKIIENDKIVLVVSIDKHDDAYRKAKRRK